MHSDSSVLCILIKCVFRYNYLQEERRKREKEAQQRKKEEEEAAKRAQEAAEVARKAQEAKEAARQEREAAEAARRAEEEAKRQTEAEEMERKEKEAEKEAIKLSEQKTKKAPELQPNNFTVIEMDKKNDGSLLAQNLVEKESQQTEAGPQHKAEPQDSRIAHEHNISLDVLEKHNKDKKIVQEANKDSIIVPTGKSNQSTTSPAATITGTVLFNTSNVLAADDVKSPQTGSPTTNTIHSDSGQSKAPVMGKLPASRSQEKRELRRQRGLEHSQRESVRAAAAGKEENCKELDHYTFISQKSEKTKKEAEVEEKIKIKPVRPSTLPLEVPASDKSKFTPKATDMPSREKSNTQPETMLKGPKRQEDQRTKMLKYG